VLRLMRGDRASPCAVGSSQPAYQQATQAAPRSDPHLLRLAHAQPELLNRAVEDALPERLLHVVRGCKRRVQEQQGLVAGAQLGAERAGLRLIEALFAVSCVWRGRGREGRRGLVLRFEEEVRPRPRCARQQHAGGE